MRRLSILTILAVAIPHVAADAADYAIESAGRSSLIDLRMIKAHDVVLGLAIKDDFLFVADRESGLRIYDISDPSKPVDAASSSATRSNDCDVYLQGNQAVVAQRGRGFSIVDIGDPHSPVMIGSYSGPSRGRGLFTDVHVRGNYAYFANAPRGLLIFDITNTKRPRLVGEYKIKGGLARDVAVRGDYAFLAIENIVEPSDAGLMIIDVSDASQPSLITSVSTAGQALNVFLSGDFAYVADVGSGLQIFDVSNPRKPQLVGSWEDESISSVCVNGDRAFAIDRFEHYVYALDIAEPSSPRLLARCWVRGGASGSAGPYHIGNIVVKGEYVYVANWDRVNVLKFRTE